MLNFPLRKLATVSITGYQRYLSPYKGFSCAYRILYQQPSCSEYFKRLIESEGLITAIKASKTRFAACREAKQILQSRTYNLSDLESNSHRKRKKLEKFCLHCDCIPDLGCELLECGDLDCLPDFDCGGLDCNIGDCG